MGKKRVTQKPAQGHLPNRRFMVGLAVLAATGIAGVVGGVAYSRMQERGVEHFVDARVHSIERYIQQLFETGRDRALLASTNAELGRPYPFRDSSPPARIIELQSTGGVYRVVADSGRDGAHMLQPRATPDLVIDPSRDVTSNLIPKENPDSIAFCARPVDGRVFCSAFPLSSLFDSSKRGAVILTSSELQTTDGRILARSPDWVISNQAYEVQTKFTLDGLDLVLRSQASERVKRMFTVSSGYEIGGFVAMVSAMCALFLVAGHRGARRQLALRNAVQRSKTSGADMIRQTLRTLAESSGILVWIMNTDETVELLGPWNDEMGVSKTTLTFDEAVGHFDEPDAIRHSLMESLRNREPWGRHVVRRDAGEVETFAGSAAPLFDGDGRFLGLLGVTTNITEALSARRRMDADHAHFSTLSKYLRQLKNEVMGPANNVKGAVANLRRITRASEDQDTQRFIALAEVEAGYLVQVVEGSLKLMNLRGSSVKDELRETDVSAVASEMARLAHEQVGADKGQRLELSAPAGMKAMADLTSLRTMLSIVLNNAFAYSPVGAEVRVQVESTGSATRITVEDGGAGMRQEELAQIGEPFFRGLNSIGTPGSGLSVAIAFELAERSSSSIEFRPSSSPGRGLLVAITLPSTPA